jgi:internalin A
LPGNEQEPALCAALTSARPVGWHDRDVPDAYGFRLEAEPLGDVVVVTGDWSRSSEEALLAPEVTGLTLNYALGFRERSLDFIREWPIQQLTILARTIDDLSPVYRLHGTLERLSVQTSPKTSIDLKQLPWLTTADTIEYAIGLNDLYTTSYGPTDLHPLQRNQALSRLRMKQNPRLTSLDGIQHLPVLSEVGIFGARRLDDIETLARSDAPSHLASLDLESCSGIVALEALAGHHDLRYLGIGNCGPVASLRPLGGMPSLQRLWAYESTRIDDGDLTPLLGLGSLTDLRMKPRKHYRPTLDEVKRQLRLEP